MQHGLTRKIHGFHAQRSRGRLPHIVKSEERKIEQQTPICIKMVVRIVVGKLPGIEKYRNRHGGAHGFGHHHIGRRAEGKMDNVLGK